MAAWPLPGGNAEQSVENVAAAANFEIAWRKGFGRGLGARVHVTAPPVAADGKIFVMDAEATVSAIDAKSGSTIWRENLRPAKAPKRDRPISFGGGSPMPTASSTSPRATASWPSSTPPPASQAWTQAVTTPIHGAPTVAGGRVFVISTDNELMTFDTATGAPGWTYQALIEPARILKASSPAVSRRHRGRRLRLGRSGRPARLQRQRPVERGAQPRQPQQRPVGNPRRRRSPGDLRGDVFAVSHSGVFTATDLRTGRPAGACRSSASPARCRPATWSMWSTRPAR
jgi:outer membrane protein assembly factor BamB